MLAIKSFEKISIREKLYKECKDKLSLDELYLVLFYKESIPNAAKIWQEYIELTTIKKSTEFEEKFEKAFIGQKKTSKIKPLVYIFPDYVYKGPYIIPQTREKLRLMLFRQDFLTLLGDNVPNQLKLYEIRDTNRIYLRMPYIGSKSEWKTETVNILGETEKREIVTKESQGIEELLPYLKRMKNDANVNIVYRSLLHYIHRVICDPIIGDPALRNVLVVSVGDKQHIVCIDFEDNRGNVDFDSDNIFEILGGKASWATKDVLNVFTRILCLKKEKIMQHLDNIKIKDIKKLIDKHFIIDLVSIENIKQRIILIKNSINNLCGETPTIIIELPESKMFYKHNHSISRHGHTQDALISALQKYIRRGELKKAQYVGVELFLFDTIPEAKALVTRTINRLRVILPEDTSGISSPELTIMFNKYYERTMKGVLSMIYLLVNSPKIRLISDIKMVFFNNVEEIAKKFPYYDKIYPKDLKEIDPEINYKLKSGDDSSLQKIANGMVSAIKHKTDNGFYWLAKLVDYIEQGIECAPRSIGKTRANNHPMNLAFEIYYAYATLGSNLWDSKNKKEKDQKMIDTLDICFSWYKDFGLKKKTTKSPKENSHRDWPIFVIWPALYCFREIDWERNKPIDPNYTDDDINDILKELSVPMQLDDYVFDKHTKKGKSMGRGTAHFAEEGAHVENEDKELLNIYYRKLYMDIRKQ